MPFINHRINTSKSLFSSYVNMSLNIQLYVNGRYAIFKGQKINFWKHVWSIWWIWTLQTRGRQIHVYGDTDIILIHFKLQSRLNFMSKCEFPAKINSLQFKLLLDKYQHIGGNLWFIRIPSDNLTFQCTFDLTNSMNTCVNCTHAQCFNSIYQNKTCCLQYDC